MICNSTLNCTRRTSRIHKCHGSYQPLEPLNISDNVSSNGDDGNNDGILYVKACGAIGKTEVAQCAILLHMIGEESLRIYDTFRCIINEEGVNSIVNK